MNFDASPPGPASTDARRKELQTVTDEPTRPDDPTTPDAEQPEAISPTPASTSGDNDDPGELDAPVASDDTSDDSSDDDEWAGDSPDDEELGFALAAEQEAFPDFNSQRLGRRGFLIGLAAAGVPVVGLVRVMEQFGGDKPTVAAPTLQETVSPSTSSPVSSVATPSASPAASPAAATPEASPVAGPPYGVLDVIRDPKPEYAEKPVDGGELRMMLTMGDNFDFNPASFSQDFQLLASYLDPLVWIDDLTMEPKPWIARKWTIKDGGKTIIFSLRDDVSWHNGDPLTADDVVFSFLVYRDGVDSAVRNLFVTMSGVTATDEHTVEVTLSTPDANFIPNAASQFIFSKKLLGDFWESRNEGQRTLDGFDWDKNPPVGTGPWRFSARDKRSLTFTRNDDYWAADPPHFETLTITWRTDPRDRIAAWRAKEVDLLWPLKAENIDDVKDVPAFLFAAPAPTTMFAAFNFNNPARAQPDLLTDLRIRQALSLAIDRPKYRETVFRSFIDVTPATAFPQPWLRNEDLVNPERSRKAARELLNEAGFRRRGDGTTVDANGDPFVLTALVRLSTRFDLRMALRSIGEDLAALGIGFDLQELEDLDFNDRWTATHDFDLIAFGYNVYPGFTDFDLYGSNWDIRVNPQGWNPGGYNNAIVDKAIKGALNAESLDDLVSSVNDLQVAANDDLFALWLGFPDDLVLAHHDLLGFQSTMYWQTWNTRKLWRRPATAPVPADVIIPSALATPEASASPAASPKP